jgi:serine/threonine-protein kinase
MIASGDRLGRYRVGPALSTGGSATVYSGFCEGPMGLARVVAIKVLHGERAEDPEAVAAMLDEARVGMRMRHPYVIGVEDAILDGARMALVLPYCEGLPLSFLLGRDAAPPLGVVSAIFVQFLEGLHAIHEARDERGARLDVVHRDVSPQNVLVGRDGIARVLDLGIAKAATQERRTLEGERKGKPRYMAPEQTRGEKVDRRADLYAVGVMLEEAVGERSPELLAIARRARAEGRGERPPTALALAQELAAAVAPARAEIVADWVDGVARDVLEERQEAIARARHANGPSAPLAVPLAAEERTEGTPQASASSASRPPRRSRAVALVVGGIVIGVLASMAATFSRPGARPEGQTEPRASAPWSTSVGLAPFAGVPSAREGAGVAPPATATASATATATATATASATATAPAPATATASAAATGTAAARAPASVRAPAASASVRAATKPACDPPWEIRPDGVRTFKVECL